MLAQEVNLWQFASGIVEQAVQKFVVLHATQLAAPANPENPALQPKVQTEFDDVEQVTPPLQLAIAVHATHAPAVY